jgi:hypothetical protein
MTRHAPDCRAVHVSYNPIVFAHARALLTSATGPTAYIGADAREFGRILAVANRSSRARCGPGARLAGNVRA